MVIILILSIPWSGPNTSSVLLNEVGEAHHDHREVLEHVSLAE